MKTKTLKLTNIPLQIWEWDQASGEWDTCDSSLTLALQGQASLFLNTTLMPEADESEVAEVTHDLTYRGNRLITGRYDGNKLRVVLLGKDINEDPTRWLGVTNWKTEEEAFVNFIERLDKKLGL